MTTTSVHLRALGLYLLTSAAVTTATHAGPFNEYLVDTTVDSVALSNCIDSTPDDCSLRGALELARLDSTDSRIVIPDGLYQLTIASAAEDGNQTGDLDILGIGDLEIAAAPGAHPVIEQTTGDRVLDVISNNVEVFLTGPMTLRGGAVSAPTGPEGLGGILRFNGGTNSVNTLVIHDVSLEGGQATSDGGCLYVLADQILLVGVSVTNCTSGDSGGGGYLSTASGNGAVDLQGTRWLDNEAAQVGGGLYLGAFSSGTMVNSIVRGNAAGLASGASGAGGGLFQFAGSLQVSSSEFSGNEAGNSSSPNSSGGGIFTSGSTSVLDLENVTVSDNRLVSSFNRGVGIFASGDLGLRHVSVVESSAIVGSRGSSGREAAIGLDPDRNVSIDLSIVVGGCSDNVLPVPANASVSLGGNVEQPAQGDGMSTSCNFVEELDQVTDDAGLLPLAPYGSLLRTHALADTSPAINNGGGLFGNLCAPFDQRGAARNQSSIRACDAGAHENNPTSPPASQSPIFFDGFELGDTSQWSGALP